MIRRGKKDRGLTVTLAVSLALHAAALVTVLLFLKGGVPAQDGPEKPVEVELVMEEHRGDAAPSAAPTPAALPRPMAKPQASAPPAPETPPPDLASESIQATQTEPAKEMKSAAPEKPAQAAAEETRPAEQKAPKITLSGTDSPSEARASGDHVIPAAPDAVFHNKPPVYPDDAALAGERGLVVLVIHVSPAGRAAGVDVVRSSGYVRLDQAAREAVMRWRFLPAVKDGRTVASDTAMQFYFDQ